VEVAEEIQLVALVESAMGKFDSNMYTNPQQNEALGSSYFEMLFKNLMGTSYYDKTQDASARADASQLESEALSGGMGSQRKLGENESAPSGSFALAKYPELWKAVTWAKTGNLPGGAGSSEKMWLKEAQDSGLRDRNSAQRKQWAEQQAALLGGRY
jgi:hypothetical protein